MQAKILILALISFSAVLNSSCSKDDDGDNNTPASKTDLLAKATWKFSDVTVAGTSVAGLVDACRKDNTITFATSGSATVDEGATKCNAGDPQSGTLTWALQNGETVLFVSTEIFGASSTTFTLVSVSETQLVVSQDNFQGTGQKATFTLVH